MAITRAQQARQMYKKGSMKPVKQAGVMNFMPSEMVTVPKIAKSSPDTPTAKLAYITPEEQNILIDLNLYGSLDGKPNRGPGGIPSLEGDFESYTSGMSGGNKKSSSQAAANRESRRGMIGSYTSTPQTYDSPPQQFVASDDDKRTNIITGGGARSDDDTPVVPKDDGPIKFVKDKVVTPTQKFLYNVIPNNPKTELNFLRSLSVADRLKLSPALRAKLEQLEQYEEDYTMSDPFDQKFTFDEFQDIASTPGFAEYAAKYGSPGLLYSGNVGNLEKFVAGKDEFGRTIYDYREKPNDDGGDNMLSDRELEYQRRLIELENQLEDQNQTTEEEEPFELARRFRADGGRIGAQEGGIMPRLNQLSGNVSSAEQMLQDINQRLESAESSLGSGGGTEVIQASGTFNGKPLFPEGTTFPSGGMKLPVFTGTPQQIDPAPFMRPGNIPGTDVPFSTLRSSLNQFSSGIDQLNVTPPQTPVAMQSPLQQAVGMADGGIMNNDIVGGMMDGNMDEMGRQMYGLGKLVKKVTRGVKKIVKSPLGKAAIAGYFLGGGSLGGILKSRPGFSFANLGSSLGLGTLSGGEENIFTGGKFSNLANIVRDKLTSTGGKFMAGATLASLLPFFGLGTGDESEEEAKKILDNSGISKEEFDRLRNDIDYQNSVLGRRSRAGGGIMRLGYQEGGDAEPVAKKTMPLLDMDGMEKDYRETGGFVEMGRMERADDVPARLSKNEFVFTADAVRNAGDGDIDKGAEVMYNMMKNLEAGGDVSEESQGLEGARRMFQTSQRLEEVL